LWGFLFYYNVLKGRVVNFTCSREYPDLYCLYVDINPGIEKTNYQSDKESYTCINIKCGLSKSCVLKISIEHNDILLFTLKYNVISGTVTGLVYRMMGRFQYE